MVCVVVFFLTGFIAQQNGVSTASSVGKLQRLLLSLLLRAESESLHTLGLSSDSSYIFSPLGVSTDSLSYFIPLPPLQLHCPFRCALPSPFLTFVLPLSRLHEMQWLFCGSGCMAWQTTQLDLTSLESSAQNCPQPHRLSSSHPLTLPTPAGTRDPLPRSSDLSQYHFSLSVVSFFCCLSD